MPARERKYVTIGGRTYKVHATPNHWTPSHESRLIGTARYEYHGQPLVLLGCWFGALTRHIPYSSRAEIEITPMAHPFTGVIP